ncbi:MAG: lipid-A-disaccharide synthase [Gammaproteobacteria bacterium]|nr:lipid-A-disaccharide synthase [Gammaproteobacteria bacterium]
MLIVIAAGEPSGDLLGADLIRAMRALDPAVEFAGIAGPAMRAAGCTDWFRTEDLSVMGLAEVLRHLPRLLGIRRRFVQRVRREQPAAFVGIDAPDFNLSVAAALRAAGTPTVQYVCPSVWAWRQGRVKTLRRACDRVLCLLPFEPAFLASAGVPATFVGHPFADQIHGVPSTAEARQALGLHGEPVIGLLPGSRASEVTLLGPSFLDAARRLQRRHAGARFVAPMATPAVRSLFEAEVARTAPTLPLTLVDGRARDVMAASDAILVASGTATLEAMLVNRPMVVAYRFAPLTYRLGQVLRLAPPPHFSLPNLLAGETLVTELLQDEVTGAALAAEVERLLDPSGPRQHLAQRFAALAAVLRQDASATAARAVLEVARRR